MSSNPPASPFGDGGNSIHSSGHGSDGDEARFDAFALSPVSDAKSTPATALPSLQSIQQQEMMMQQQQAQQQQQQGGTNRQLDFDDGLPSPEELQMKGPMNSDAGGSGNNWPPAPPLGNNNYNTAATNAAGVPNSSNQSFLSKLVTCGGICSVEVLRPYFDVDTADVLLRVKASMKYIMVNDGFRNEVLYSDNAMRLAYRDTSSASGSSGGEEGGASAQTTQDTTSSGPGKGPDLYGPVWITLTLVFFVAVTSNMSLYVHHTHKKKSIVDEGGIAAEEEWDYDINQLLHATWILYSFSMGLPALMYFVLRLVGVNGISGGVAELVCLYGYSLVPYLPVAWLCILPFGWLQWLFLGVATVLSGMMVLRNVAGSILESSLGGGGGGISGLQGKSGGLIMCLVGCHFVFFLVMKLAFYHHHSV